MMADNVTPLHAWKGKLNTGKTGPKKTISNLMLFLKNLPELGNTIRWNELAQRAEWNGRPIEDSDLVDIRLILEQHDFEAAKDDVLPAVLRHAKENAFHPIRDYLSSLKWDGLKRLDRWMTLCLGAPDSPFVRMAARKTLIAAVARAFKPGCKVDTVLVLEGPQGIKKSTAIATLFGEGYTAESVNLFDQHNKMVMAMMGAWCVELAEFVALLNRDKNVVKGLLSMRSDRVVLPYAKIASDHPRQCVFFGTINPGDSGYLTDTTGNRRYWPVEVTKADIELIEDRRDQIWAEAAKAYFAGEGWWIEDDDEALQAEQAAEVREEYDIWVELVADKLAGRQTMTTSEALSAIGVPFERMDRKAELRAAKCLRRIGFERVTPKEKVAGVWKTVRRWERTPP
jgi:predicted P-loop ATPase